MAKDSIKFEITKEELIKYVYAVECAIDANDSHESPLLNQYLIELKNKLTKLNK